MTQFRTPNLGSTPYMPGQKALTGYDPIEQFEKDFNTQVSPRLVKLFTSQLSKHHNLKFVESLLDDTVEELVYTYNYMVCTLAELSSVSHHVIINSLAEAPFLVREAMLNIAVALPRDKVYDVKIACSKAHFEEDIYIGQLLLFAADAVPELEHPKPVEKKQSSKKKVPVLEPV